MVFHLLSDFVHQSGEVRVGGHLCFDLVAGVHDRGMVFAAEGVADFRGGTFGERSGQIHGDLARERDGVGATF